MFKPRKKGLLNALGITISSEASKSYPAAACVLRFGKLSPSFTFVDTISNPRMFNHQPQSFKATTMVVFLHLFSQIDLLCIIR